MIQRGTGRIEVGPDDALPDLLLRVKATRGDEAVIAIPEDSGVLLTASEFRTLKSTADQVRVAITLETNDKLRGQLASMFGFDHTPFLSDEQQAVVEEHPSWPTPDSRLVPSRVSVPVGDLTTSKPWRAEPVDASSGISVPPKPVPRPEYAMEPRTGAIASQEPEARARAKPSTVIGLIIGLVAAMSIAAVLSVVLRTAEITIRTQRQPVSTQLTIGYSTDGSDVPGAAITLPAESAQFTVPYTEQVASTGTLPNQGGVAGGTVELRNISGRVVDLPAGTQLQMADEVAYVTTTDVRIPGGEAENPGRAEVAIQAVNPGTTGNREPGTLTGQIPELPGVYFGNPGRPITGGTDVEILVVTEDDLAAARDRATQQIGTLAAAYQLPDGRVVVPSSVQQAGDISVEADQPAGAQVDTFTVTAQATYQALTIDPDDLPESVRSQLRSNLGALVPNGFSLTNEPIRLTDPVESEPGSGLITVSISIDAAQDLTPELTAQIRDLASDQSQENARDALATVDGVEIVDISVSPSLFVNSLPGEDKIEVLAE